MTNDAWRRLGDLLTARRVELGFPRRLTWSRDVLGLNNDRIQSDLENARRDNYDSATLAQVEQQYQWAPGSIRAILTGGDPVPLAQSPADRDSTARVDVSWLELQELDTATLEWREKALHRQLLELSDEIARLEFSLRTALDERHRLNALLSEVRAARSTADEAYLFSDLTGQQDTIVRFISEHLDEYGTAPSMKQIGEAVGLKSRSAVAHALRALEQGGAFDEIRAKRQSSDDLMSAISDAVDAGRLAEAARDVGKPSRGQQKRAAVDQAGTESQERPGSEEGA